MTRWSSEVDDLIREAVAEGMRFSVAFKKLKAGTLGDLGPQAMPERTFSFKWQRAKREQQRAQTGSSYDGPGILDYVMLTMARKELGEADADALAARSGLKPSAVRELLGMEARKAIDGILLRDQIEEKRAAATGERIGAFNGNPRRQP